MAPATTSDPTVESGLNQIGSSRDHNIFAELKRLADTGDSRAELALARIGSKKVRRALGMSGLGATLRSQQHRSGTNGSSVSSGSN